MQRRSLKALDACAPNLANRLGPNITPSHSILGQISNYFVTNYGFSKYCEIVAFSGDNPNAVAGNKIKI